MHKHFADLGNPWPELEVPNRVEFKCRVCGTRTRRSGGAPGPHCTDWCSGFVCPDCHARVARETLDA